MKHHCISVEILKHRAGDCSNGGISSQFDDILLEVPDGNIIIDDDKPLPPNFCRVVRRHLFGREYVHVEPVSLASKCAMFGGCLCYTCDARFHDAVNNGGYAVSLHDRVED